MRWSILLLALAVTAWGQENLLQQGDFSAASVGGPPPAPWVTGKPKSDVNVSIENLPGSDDKKLWAHFTDESGADAIILTQTFPGTTAGRLDLSLHVQKYGAGIWFILGRKNLAARDDMLFTFKVTTKGGFLASTPSGKLTDLLGAKSFTFGAGQTYDLYCDFKPSDDQSGLDIEIGQKGGAVLFKGKLDRVEPVTAFSIRTHGEDVGSDFYVTDVVLKGTPQD
jgi:hypothetical protein